MHFVKFVYAIDNFEFNLSNLHCVLVSVTGKSLTEACYKTELRTLVEQDPKLRGLPLRCAAVSKLCELRVKAEHFLEV